MLKSKTTAAIAAALLSLATGAHAGAAYEFSSAGNSYSNGSWDFGWTFTANTALTVSGLGYYADPNNGFVDSNQVSLYTSSGTLLATATVDNTYALNGHFRYVTISSPITLVAGQTYQIDGVSHSDNYTWDDSGFTTDPDITYVSNSWEMSSNSEFQTNVMTDTSAGYHGPNLFFGEPTFTTSVPEPTSMALMMLGLAGIGAAARRRKS